MIRRDGTVDLSAIVEDALSIMEASLRKRRVEIRKQMALGPSLVVGDRVSLMRAVLNILKNACEAFDVPPSASSGRWLEVHIQADPGQQTVCLCIRDNGCGFDPALAESLFERGYTSKSQGSGIGLVDVRTIIGAHGGTVTLTSAGPGTGTECRLLFPVPGRPDSRQGYAT